MGRDLAGICFVRRDFRGNKAIVDKATVIFLDDDEDVGFVLGELLASRFQAKCLHYGSLEAFQSNRAALAQCVLVFLDVNLGANQANGIDAYRWLLEIGFDKTICFLTAHAENHPQVAKARGFGVKVLEKPIASDPLCTFVQSVINGAKA